MRTLILISVIAGLAVPGEAAAMKIERDTARLVCGQMKSGDGGKNSGCNFCNKLYCYDINCKKGAKTCDATKLN